MTTALDLAMVKLSRKSVRWRFNRGLLVTAILWTSFCTQAQESLLRSELKIDTTTFIRIWNKSNDSKTVSFSINDRHFFVQYSDILKRAIPEPVSGEDSVKMIWDFTARHSYHYYPMTPYVWMHDPLTFFNSAGFGFCDDAATINELLWKFMGYDARTWWLDGHVVSEVYQGEKWKMLDSDLGCYYLNDSLMIASVEEVLEAPRLVMERRNEIPVRVHEVNYKEADWKFLSEIFSQRSGYPDFTPLDSVLTSKSVQFELPARSSLLIGDKIEPQFLTDVIQGRIHQVKTFSNIVLDVPYAKQWRVELPLIIQGIKGTGTITINDESYRIGDPELDLKLRTRTDFIHSLYIEEARDLKIIFLFNRRIFDLAETNELKVYGEDLKGVRIKNTKRRS
ncbi:hypothetical protein KK083_28770 [Fulvivirgaceae bacterium PWU4]|uniref:Transglutaminase domain-containing protein n=1 Tax=Chryseosolibacter histidini TaxID=2782349 RepID=A0AAP2DQY2_9BACT|nr:hypothetical protein [Chryseosolibacter histidini]MBT1700920.1 hypothetical protein [Chryseosolibacter histidini]